MIIDTQVTVFVALVAHADKEPFAPEKHDFVGVYSTFDAAQASVEAHVRAYYDGEFKPAFEWRGSDSKSYANAVVVKGKHAAQIHRRQV